MQHITFTIVIISFFLLFSGCIEEETSNTITSTVTEKPVEIVEISTEITTEKTTTEPTTEPVCFYNFKYETASDMGLWQAPQGKTYAIVTIKIDNTLGNDKISTSPYNWKFVGNGITYSFDMCTLSGIWDSQIVDISPGYSRQTQIVYLIDDDLQDAKVVPDYFLNNPVYNKDLKIE